jgi:hypothetical protein
MRCFNSRTREAVQEGFARALLGIVVLAGLAFGAYTAAAGSSSTTEHLSSYVAQVTLVDGGDGSWPSNPFTG